MKVLYRPEVLTVPEGVRVVRTSRSRLGEFSKQSGAKVAPMAVVAASVRIKLLSRLWLEPVLEGSISNCKQPPGAGCAVCVSLASPGIWTCV